LAAACARLAAAGVASPRWDAELLASHVWGIEVGQLRAHAWAGHPVDDADPHLAQFAAAIAQRASRMPLQHITGHAPFRALDLAVGPGVFIPRPETETTAETAITAARGCAEAGEGGEMVRVVDLGTGSGAIAAAVATEVPCAEVWAVELDPAAFLWAARNLAAVTDAPAIHDSDGWQPMVEALAAGAPPAPFPQTRATLLLADATAPPPQLAGVADVVVSNPPYIPEGQPDLDPEVAQHDPPAALYGGGRGGMEVPAAIVHAAAHLVKPGGVVVIEHGADQGAAMRLAAHEAGLAEAVTLKDLAGRDRVLRAVRPPHHPPPPPSAKTPQV
jgi:release factor glutamine methyltransferase